METLLELDKKAFLWLNSFHSPFWDNFFLAYTNSRSWTPVILVMVFLLFKNFSWRQALIYLVLIGAAVGLCDFIASGILKSAFERLRPCHDFPGEMTLVGNCGGMYGFASSHAANSFGLFSGFSRAFKGNRYVFWLLLAWAILMSYSRIYVGVHQPGDVLAGALIGMVVPKVFFDVYERIGRTKNGPLIWKTRHREN
ncbi:phosphatase PAP2 family protein [Leadbetterella sp. DM7]|uniref:phosphatase PAP2 family protein n=1 Tax=Leadbetterella sp. DM7 TaxID=3235085 RepID=UPI00349E82E6